MIPLDIFVLVTIILSALFVGTLALYIVERQYSNGLYKRFMVFIEFAECCQDRNIVMLKQIEQTLKKWKEVK